MTLKDIFLEYHAGVEQLCKMSCRNLTTNVSYIRKNDYIYNKKGAERKSFTNEKTHFFSMKYKILV